MTLHILPAAAAAVAPANMLSSRAMLAGLNIRQWAARKLDKRVSEEVAAQHGAAADVGRYNKALVAKDSLAAIIAAANAARSVHYARTLPWLDDGSRILPAAAFQAYSDRLRAIRQDFESAVAAFVAGYPAYVQDARTRLNGLFDPNDYPSEREIAGRFSFSVRILPLPDSADFRADLDAAQADRIRQEIADATREAMSTAIGDAWQRIVESVGRMVDRLNAYKPASGSNRAEGIFRDSLVENVRELVDLLPAFNLTSDPFLADIAARMARDLCQHDAAELRDNADLRRDTAKAAESILADVTAYLA
jgi:hypothetical protein